MDIKKIIKVLYPGNKTLRFFVGKGVFVTENTIIPIKSISAINVHIPPVSSYASAVIWGILGFFALCGNGSLMKSLGTILIIIAIMFAGLTYFMNTHRVFALHIQTHSGFRVTIESKELDYIRELKDQFLKCLNDMSQITYIDVSNHTYMRAENMNTQFVYGDNMEIKGNTIGGNFTASNSGQANSTNITGDYNRVQSSQEVASFQSVLTDQQWKLLAQYFCDQSNVSQKYKKECSILNNYAKNRDESGLKKFMKQLGSKVMTEIVGAGTKEILSIIKILLMG